METQEQSTKELSLKEKTDWAYEKLKEMETPKKDKKENIGWGGGLIGGIIAGVVIFFISIFLWTFWTAAGIALACVVLFTFIIAKLKWSPWIPFGAKVGRRKARKGYVIVFKVGYNKGSVFERQEIIDGTIMVDGIPRPVYDNNIALYKGKKPMVIAFSWRIPLLDFSQDYEKSFEAGLGTKGWRVLLSRMKTEAVEEKKKMSGMLIFIIILAIAAGAYFAIKGGWF